MIAATEGATMFVGLALLRAEGGHQLRRRHGCYRSRYSGTRRAGALLVGDVGYVAMTAAAGAAVMLVVLMLLLGEGGIGGVGNDADAVVGAVMLVVLVLFSLEASASCDGCCHGRRNDACRACAAPR